jgi:hypothetical protein
MGNSVAMGVYGGRAAEVLNHRWDSLYPFEHGYEDWPSHPGPPVTGLACP